MAVAALVFALVALSPAETRAQPRMPTHVACVGDSITAGYAASSSSKSYPSVLQTMFGNGVQVMNFGHSGATLLSIGDLPYINQSEYTAATTFVGNAGASAVVDVIIMLGTNDSKSYNWAPSAGSTRAAQFMTDLAAMVDHFANLSTHPVVFLAVPAAIYTNTFGISETVTNNEIAPIVRQVAMQKAAPIIDVHAATTGHADYFSDGVHPTDAGYAYLAGVMHDGLLRVPTVSITAPAAGASIAGTTVSITATASGGTVPITSVQFLRATTSIATVTQSPFTTMWTNATPGSYSLTAKATDRTGAAATSAAVMITVSGGGGTGGSTGAGGGAGRGGAGGAAGNGGGGTAGAGSGGAGGSIAGVGGTGGAGAAGRGGTTGAAGTSGGAGTSGSAGTTGAAGTSGSAGTTGAAGTSGSAGTSGGAGTTGGTGTGGATTADAGTDASAPGDGGGCGCRLGGGPRGGEVWLGLAVIIVGLRRSRRRRSGSR